MAGIQPPAWFVALERVLLGSADPWLVRLPASRSPQQHRRRSS
jgi:hypothetical protein